ncbi:MAG: arginine--tRNA ligase [bacterium]|nr:arginine--tRNA ligase [bacterium]
MNTKASRKKSPSRSVAMVDTWDVLLISLSSFFKTGIASCYHTPFTVFPSSFVKPPQTEMGDIAFACFPLTILAKKAPPMIAIDLAIALNKSKTLQKLPITKIVATGPYVNIFFNPDTFAKELLPTILKHKHFGTGSAKQKEQIMIEYVSPNTNKPLHVGHTRNAALGASIAKLLISQGHTVTKTKVVNDRGIHICKSMVAYQEAIQEAKEKKQSVPTPQNTGIKGDHFVGDYYVAFDAQAKKSEAIIEEAQNCLLKWEANDKKTRALWKKMNIWALDGHNQTYKELEITFDDTYLESDMYTKGKDMILNGLKKKIFTTDETGAVMADLSKYNLPNKVLLRQDGTTLYITQDIYLAVHRAKQLKLDRAVYVVGAEQDLYFKQLFAILDILGYKWAKKLYHASYGMVTLPEGKMKSREGTVVDIDDLLAELETLARQEICQREASLSKKEIQHRGHTIALAALKYYLLHSDPQNPVMFNPKESISFQGNTGPYLLYTYARFKNILQKGKYHSGVSVPKGYDFEGEKSLLLHLATFPQEVRTSALEYNPAKIARYSYTLAKKLNEYYHEVPVLKAPPIARTARLTVIDSALRTLQNALDLLNIPTLDHM